MFSKPIPPLGILLLSAAFLTVPAQAPAGVQKVVVCEDFGATW